MATALTIPVALCDTCVDGCGFIWPIATDGDTRHQYVERCDACDRFADDTEALTFIQKRLQEQDYSFDAGWEWIRSIHRKAPYIDNVREFTEADVWGHDLGGEA